eukprot:SAG11_NODE_98_length_16927_cov_35.166211_8_plen_105_part_00
MRAGTNNSQLQALFDTACDAAFGADPSGLKPVVKAEINATGTFAFGALRKGGGRGWGEACGEGVRRGREGGEEGDGSETFTTLMWQLPSSFAIELLYSPAVDCG